MLRSVWLAVVCLSGLAMVGCGGGDSKGLGTGGTAGAAGAAGSGGNGASGGNGGSAGSTAGTGGSGGGIGDPCESTEDCASGVCDELAERCVECLFTTDCDGEARCVDKACVDNTECRNSLDCVDAPAGPICDPETSLCEQCVAPTDCEGTADCVDHRCVPFAACKNSLDCELGQVCDTNLERCVECISSTDCEDGESCVANQCKTLVGCQSDNQCTPLGQLCDRVLGVCVDCLKNADCPTAYHCSGGGCALDACAEGSSRCTGNAVESCLPDGVGWGAPLTCAGSSSCVQAGAQASCMAWECEPSAAYCSGDEARECAADGLSSSLIEDCASEGLNCVGGACSALVCEANAFFCDGNDVRLCDGTGTSSSVFETCTSTQFCNPLTTYCEAQVCSPGQPACNGDTATTCNANGSGYLPGGTNCASSGQSCVAGSCQACAPGSATRSLRLIEVFTGTGDYVVLQNRHPTCSANLLGVTLSTPINSPSSTILFPLPDRTLAPLASVRVVEQGGTVRASDITLNSTINWVSDTDGAALLCQGSTCTSANVIDAVRWNTTGMPWPAGINFSPSPMTGLMISNEETHSYTRRAYAGAAPNFVAADWTTGAATVPYNVCPATQPVNGSTCTDLQANCSYGAVTCTCFLTWTCT